MYIWKRWRSILYGSFGVDKVLIQLVGSITSSEIWQIQRERISSPQLRFGLPWREESFLMNTRTSLCAFWRSTSTTFRR